MLYLVRNLIIVFHFAVTKAESDKGSLKLNNHLSLDNRDRQDENTESGIITCARKIMAGAFFTACLECAFSRCLNLRTLLLLGLVFIFLRLVLVVAVAT